MIINPDRTGRVYSEIILTQEHLAAIGSVAIESSNCERLIESIIWNILGIKESQGKFISKASGFKTSIDLMTNLVRERLKQNAEKNDEILKEFSEITAALTKANERRNIVIHGDWRQPFQNFLDMLGRTPEEFPTAKVFKRQTHSAPIEFPAEEAREVAVDLSHLQHRLLMFISTEAGVFQTSPNK